MSFFSRFFGDNRTTTTNNTQSGSSTGNQSFGITPQIQEYAQSIGGIFNPANYAGAYAGPNQWQTGAVAGNPGLFQQAAGIASNGIDPNNISRFMSPYLGNVVQQTQAQFDRSNAQKQAQDQAFAIKAGVPAMGGTQLAANRQLGQYTREQAQAPVIAGLYNQGFNTAADLARQSATTQLAGVGAAGNILGQQFQQGTTLQQNQQYGNLLPYQLAQQGAQTLAGLAQGSGMNTSGTTQGTSSGTSTQNATPSPFSILSNLAGMAISAYASDERVKENIREVGETHDGQKIYRYNYKGDPRTQIGLLAQEVERHHPEAVGSFSGIKTVDYAAATDDAVRGRQKKADGGAIEPYHGKNPTDQIGRAFTAIRSMMSRANGGPVMVPYHGYDAGGAVGGSWATSVFPEASSGGFDMKKLGQGLSDMSKQGSGQGQGQDSGVQMLSQAQSDLSSRLAQLQQQTMPRMGFDAGGAVEWNDGQPAFGPTPAPVMPAYVGGPPPTPAPAGGSRFTPWTDSDETWAKLNPYQRVAAMAYMEADGRDPESARNAAGAIINRAFKSREDLGAHVSKPIYQPTIEPSQRARLGSILKMPEYLEMVKWAEDRAAGRVADPVNGATHFLAHEPTMLRLSEREPNKYKSWRQWTGFDPETGQYKNVYHRDKSHAFLAPEGRWEGQPPQAQPPDGMDAASYGDRSSLGGPTPAATGAGGAPAAAGASARAASPAAPDRPWWMPRLDEGVWAGKEMTPMQRLGTALMSVSSPTMNAPGNNVAANVLAMNKQRMEQAQIDQRTGELLGMINGQPTLAAKAQPSEIAQREAVAKFTAGQESRAAAKHPYDVSHLILEDQSKRAELMGKAPWLAEMRGIDRKVTAGLMTPEEGKAEKERILDFYEKSSRQFGVQFPLSPTPRTWPETGGPQGGAAPAGGSPAPQAGAQPQRTPTPTPVPAQAAAPVAPPGMAGSQAPAPEAPAQGAATPAAPAGAPAALPPQQQSSAGLPGAIPTAVPNVPPRPAVEEPPHFLPRQRNYDRELAQAYGDEDMRKTITAQPGYVYEKQASEARHKLGVEAQQEFVSAKKAAQDVRDMGALIELGAKPGAGAEFVNEMKRMWNSFGLHAIVGKFEDVGPTEAFKILQTGPVLDGLRAMRPATDKDREFIEKATATIKSDPEALKLLLPHLTRTAERTALAAQYKLDAYSKNRDPNMAWIERDIETRFPSPFPTEAAARRAQQQSNAQPPADATRELIANANDPRYIESYNRHFNGGKPGLAESIIQRQRQGAAPATAPEPENTWRPGMD